MNKYGSSFIVIPFKAINIVLNGWMLSIYRPHGRGWPKVKLQANIWRKTKTAIPRQGQR